MTKLMMVVILALMPTLGSAQVLYGTLVGNVTDQTGAPIPNAKVEALNTSNGQLKSATTDDRGAYFFNDLQTGTYKVTSLTTSTVPDKKLKDENYASEVRVVTITLNWTSGSLPRSRSLSTLVSAKGIQNYVY